MKIKVRLPIVASTQYINPTVAGTYVSDKETHSDVPDETMDYHAHLCMTIYYTR